MLTVCLQPPLLFLHFLPLLLLLPPPPLPQWVRLNLDTVPVHGDQGAQGAVDGLQPLGALVPRGPGFGPRVIG